MTEPVQLAKEARQRLAAALSALQQPDVPDDLVAAAEPIAQAMGVLHRIERTNGANLDGRKEVVEAVRAALGRVQLVESLHPAVETVMEAIAGSLSKVHALMRYEPPVALGNPGGVPQTPPVALGNAVSLGNPGGVPQTPPVVQAVAPSVSALRPAPQPDPVPAPQPAPQPLPVPGAWAPPPQPAEPRGPAPVAADRTLPLSNATLPIANPQPVTPVYAENARRETPPVLSPQLVQEARQAAIQPAPQATAPYVAPVSTAPPVARTAQSAQPVAVAPAPAPAPAAVTGASGSRIDVELGIHSTSNFYKGLGGNDVIEHGGIFVATYKILKLNAPVTLRVLLPGDYEFTATAVVQWTRDAGSSEPGYGARFTQISPEGRQLVYRYTRNREPMFYDDL